MKECPNCHIAPSVDGACEQCGWSAGSARIRVYRQKGPGYWAIITHADGRREPVQSAQIYGFETAKEAREEARRRCEQNSSFKGE